MVAFGAFGAAWKYQSHKYKGQIASLKLEHAEKTVAAVKEALQTERKDAKRINDALKQATERADTMAELAKRNERAASSANALASRVRDELATTRASMPGLSCEAVRIRAERLSDVFEQCVEKYARSADRYRELAEDASKSASDLQLLDESWPTK